jgi:hypothetical protein
MKYCTLIPAGLATLMLCVDNTEAHSWVEKLLLIASNGTFVGTPGYPRGFVPRTSPAFSDFVSENQIPPNGRPTATEILSTDLMCRPSQIIGNQTPGNPALVAAPGDNIALIYEENGHVTLLDRSPTKPVGSGTVFIYGTKQPSNSDTYLGIHRVWNEAGTGGDKRGKLLATRPFDDGQCYQNNTSPLAESRRAELGTLGNDLPCQNNVQLPEDAGTSGMYTLYWLWEWPTLDNTTGKIIANQSYTTCMDIAMTPKKLANAGGFNSKQVVDSRAIQAQLSTAFLVDPTIAEQLTTTQGVAAKQTTAAASVFSPLQASTNRAGATTTVTITAGAGAGKTKTEVVTVTTTVCDCESAASDAPTAPTASSASAVPVAPTVTPIVPGPQAQASPAQVDSTNTQTQPSTIGMVPGAATTTSAAL